MQSIKKDQLDKNVIVYIKPQRLIDHQLIFVGGNLIELIIYPSTYALAKIPSTYALAKSY